jgi:hypothetical protein
MMVTDIFQGCHISFTKQNFLQQFNKIIRADTACLACLAVVAERGSAAVSLHFRKRLRTQPIHPAADIHAKKVIPGPETCETL